MQRGRHGPYGCTTVRESQASCYWIDPRQLHRSGNRFVPIDHIASRGDALAAELIPASLLFEQSRDGIHILDTGGKLLKANRQFEKMLGYTHQEAKGLHVWDWDTRFTREELLERLRKADPAGLSFDTGFRRKDGSIIDVEISSNLIEWRGQTLIYGVCQDISERKKAEQALLEREERFRVLVEQAADGFFILDEQGTLVDVNQMACTMLGFSREDLLGIGAALAEVHEQQQIAHAHAVRYGPADHGNPERPAKGRHDISGGSSAQPIHAAREATLPGTRARRDRAPDPRGS